MQQKTKPEFQKPLTDREKYTGRTGLVYVRVSSKKQEIEGHGRESQEQRCKQDLVSIKVPHEKTFPDTITGDGDFMQRPAMRELLAYIDAHPNERYVVVFDDLKRLARNVEAHFKLRAAFRVRDVELRCPNYNFDESEEGEFVEHIFAAQAQLERKQNRRQVIQKQKARLDAGYWCFGPRKGYTHTKDRTHGKLLVPTEEGREVLKPALEMYATGVFQTKVEACAFLVEKGFWKKGNPERYIDKFKEILENAAYYAGFMVYAKWGVEKRAGYHEGIISEETLALIERRLLRGDKVKVRKDTSADFPLRGLLVCADCKVPLTGAFSKGRTKKYAYYLGQNKKCLSCGKGAMAKDKVEEGFTAVLKRNRLKKDTEKLISLAFEGAWKEEAAYAVGREKLFAEEARKAKEKVRQLTDEILNTTNSELKRVYEEQLAQVAKDLKQLEALKPLTDADMAVPYQTALGKATRLLKDPYSAWENMDVYEQHKLFFFIFDEKLAYSKSSGYQTATLTCATRLFEEFVGESDPICGDGRN